MADVKWIKIVTDVFDDEKMILIDGLPERDAIIVIWFKMLCMAGKANNGGVFMLNDKIAYTDEMLSTIFRRPINTVRLALSTFESFGMIEIVNNTITIPNWEKHQSLDKLEKARADGRKRQQKFRAKQKALALGNGDSNVTITEDNATDKKRKEKEKKKNREAEEAVKGASAPDYDDRDDRLQKFKGNVMLSENQIAYLLSIMEIETFNEYLKRLDDFITNNNANIKNHCATIEKWYNEDRAVNA